MGWEKASYINVIFQVPHAIWNNSKTDVMLLP